MAELVLTDGKLWFDGFDLSGDMNAIAVNYGAEQHDDTAINETTKSVKGGMKTVIAQHEGMIQYGTDLVDEALYNRIATANKLMSLAAKSTEGERSFFFNSEISSYVPLQGSVGDLLKFSVSAEADGDLIRGLIMLNATNTSSGNGTAFQAGAISAAQKLYAGLHVIAASGGSPTLDVTIDSDDNEAFTSGVTRGTFTQKTAIGSEWLTPVSGPITDDWWRIAFTIGGSTPSFQFVVNIGIQ